MRRRPFLSRADRRALLLLEWVLVLVVLAGRVVPLCENRAAHVVCLATSLAASLSSVLVVFSMSGGAQMAVAWAAVVCGSVAAALLILMWCELLSCLDIARIALCLALVYLTEQVLVFFGSGLPAGKLAVSIVVLPLLSQFMLVRAYSYIGPESRPRRGSRQPLSS